MPALVDHLEHMTWTKGVLTWQPVGIIQTVWCVLSPIEICLMLHNGSVFRSGKISNNGTTVIQGNTCTLAGHSCFTQQHRNCHAGMANKSDITYTHTPMAMSTLGVYRKQDPSATLVQVPRKVLMLSLTVIHACSGRPQTSTPSPGYSAKASDVNSSKYLISWCE